MLLVKPLKNSTLHQISKQCLNTSTITHFEIIIIIEKNKTRFKHKTYRVYIKQNRTVPNCSGIPLDLELIR